MKDDLIKYSLATKINTSLSVVFIIVMVIVLYLQVNNERKLVDSLMLEQIDKTADSWFDSLNILMLSGTMAQRETLRTKILSDDNVVDGRVIRGKLISSIFGPGNKNEQAKDSYDNKGLAGEMSSLIETIDGIRVLTVVKPMLAEKEYKGTNCLTCHVVPEKSVLGAVRISYSLQKLDQQINYNMLVSAGWLVLVFVVGFLFILFMIRRLVSIPLTGLKDSIDHIESNALLSMRLDITSKDEIASVANAFNKMLEKFSNSIQKVKDTTDKVHDFSAKISKFSENTLTSALAQQDETSIMVVSMKEMEKSVEVVQENAKETINVSSHADKKASQGRDEAQLAIDSIYSLQTEVKSASKVISSLEEKSNQVSSVVDVIRGIAEQTNLLALNAAIEAARAGEQGRGFAVVADEVRALASKTQDATQEIQDMINTLLSGTKESVQVMVTSQQSSEHGVIQVEKVSESLNDIATMVNSINGLNEQMNVGAKKQVHGASQINQNIISINNKAISTTTDVQKIKDISQNLVGLSEQLDSLVEVFKI